MKFKRVHSGRYEAKGKTNLYNEDGSLIGTVVATFDVAQYDPYRPSLGWMLTATAEGRGDLIAHSDIVRNTKREAIESAERCCKDGFLRYGYEWCSARIPQ